MAVSTLSQQVADDQAGEDPPAKFPDGSLVVQRRSAPSLVLVTSEVRSGTRHYVVTYVQFPALGRPSGGSSFFSAEDDFRWPETAVEVATAAQYRARERALALADEVMRAEKDADAMDRAVVLMREQAAGKPCG